MDTNCTVELSSVLEIEGEKEVSIGVPETNITSENFQTLYDWLETQPSCSDDELMQIKIKNADGKNFTYSISLSNYYKLLEPMLKAMGVPRFSWRSTFFKAPINHILTTNGKGKGIEIKNCTFEMSLKLSNASGTRYHISIPETYITQENFNTLYQWLNSDVPSNTGLRMQRIILGNSQGQKFTFMITYDNYVHHKELLQSFGIPPWGPRIRSEAPVWHAVDRIADLLSKALTM
jgi:hypothetical protein